MKIKVKTDETVRTIYLDVEGAEPMEVPKPWRTQPRPFRPDQVSVRVTGDGQFLQVSVSGPRVLKSGADSDKARESESWYGPQGFAKEAPAWLQEVAREAVAGVTQWTR